MSAEETRRTALAVLAGEAVLGTADPQDIERLRDDPVFQEEAQAWERRLSPLLALPPALHPSPELWSRIALASDLEGEADPTSTVTRLAAHRPAAPELNSAPLDLAEVRPSRAEPAAAVELDTPAPVIDFEQAVAARTRQVHRRLAVWRRTAIGSGALAACLAVLLGVGALGLHRQAGSRYIGVVDAQGGAPPLVVSLDTSSGELMVRPVGMQSEPGKSHELWALPPGGQPVSLGVVDAGGHRPMSGMPMSTWRDPNLVLAVSVEPQGGSPTGLPTGPVVYKGKLIQAE